MFIIIKTPTKQEFEEALTFFGADLKKPYHFSDYKENSCVTNDKTYSGIKFFKEHEKEYPHIMYNSLLEYKRTLPEYKRKFLLFLM